MPQRLFDSRLFLLCLIDGAEAAGHGGSLTFTQTRQLVQESDPPCPAVLASAATAPGIAVGVWRFPMYRYINQRDNPLQLIQPGAEDRRSARVSVSERWTAIRRESPAAS